MTIEQIMADEANANSAAVIKEAQLLAEFSNNVRAIYSNWTVDDDLENRLACAQLLFALHNKRGAIDVLKLHRLGPELIPATLGLLDMLLHPFLYSDGGLCDGMGYQAPLSQDELLNLQNDQKAGWSIIG